MWCAVTPNRTVEPNAIQSTHAFHKTLFKTIQVLYLFVKIRKNLLNCPCHSCNTWNILCTRTHSFLLSPTKNNWTHFCPLIDVQKPNTFWPMYLVSTGRQQVNMHTFRINSILPKPLYSIHMKQSIGIHALY